MNSSFSSGKSFGERARTHTQISILQWTPLGKLQLMGKTSSTSRSRLNLPGRYAWAAAEAVGPINLIYIMYTLPHKLGLDSNSALNSSRSDVSSSSSSVLGTGLPVAHELLGALYVLHYVNRAGLTPLVLAPTMSPIHATISLMMMTFQFVNSSNIACWLVYSAASAASGGGDGKGLLHPLSLLGLATFLAGLALNIVSENTLFTLRRAAAKRKARSEGKPFVTYDKVYVIPPATGYFRHMLYPHYLAEWVEWVGYWILAGSAGAGLGYWNTPAMWFVVNEVCTMLPRAVSGRKWYEKTFDKRRLEGRGAMPFGPWL